jgi:hypothetical protein
MANAALMDIFDTGNELLKHSYGSLLMKPLVRHNIVKELSILTVFHNQKKLFVSFNYFIELNNIWMSDFFQNFDLSAYPLDILFIFNSIFFEYFDGNFFIGKQMSRQLDFAKGSLPKCFSK